MADNIADDLTEYVNKLLVILYENGELISNIVITVIMIYHTDP